MNGQPESNLVGRANRDGAAMVRGWFEGLANTAEQGRGAAYVFVMGSMVELLRCFDLDVVFPEINSLQTAVRRVSHEYLDIAEDYGYSTDICGYVKADVAVQINDGQHPMGRVPKPALAVLTNACNTYIKWAEIWERLHGMPVFTLDVPGCRQAGGGSRPGDSDYENDCRYVEAQLEELIRLCEEVTGRRFDIDRLRTHLAYCNRANRGWERILELNRARPAVFNALMDGTVYLGVANALRGTEEGARYFEDLVEELEHKAAHQIGTVEPEQYRLIFVGVPCYPIFRRFNELFSDWGGAFVHSTYLWFASGGSNLGYQYNLDDPMRSLAQGTLETVRDAMDSMFFQDRILEDAVRDFDIDGIVFHPIKSCRTVSTGLADTRRAVMEASDIPSLFIESDMMDPRVVSEAQLKNRIDAFFEGLASRRTRAAIKR